MAEVPPSQDALSGEWRYGFGKRYKLTAVEGRYLFEEKANGHKLTAMLDKAGDWYEGTVVSGEKVFGSIRVRLHRGKVVSNFRAEGQNTWGQDTIAVSQEDDVQMVGESGVSLRSIKGYTAAENATSVTISIDLDLHLYDGAAGEITDISQVVLQAGREDLKLSVWPVPEELWSLELYPLAGEICPHKAVVNIEGGKILLELPKAVIDEQWGRIIGDICKSWRDVGKKDLIPLSGGLLDCARRCADKTIIPEHKHLTSSSQKIMDLLHKERFQVGRGAPDLNHFSIFYNVTVPDRQQLLDCVFKDPAGNRAIGAMMGMAIADAVGSPLEFLPVGSKGHYFDPEILSFIGAYNKFRLQAGQWTDDTSMGLCLADSLLACGKYDGSDIRVRFWNWWYRGYNNAFRLDASRSGSVGLGGNIGKSLNDIQNAKPSPRFEVDGSEDSGNGSLMRLAPIPILFHKDIDLAVRVSAESSLTTHPGTFAADACGFLGFVIARAIARPAQCTATAAEFLDACCEAYLKRPAVDEQPTLRRLLLGQEPVGSMERCWNWRDPDGPFLCETLAARGHVYNGYPVSAGYFGSYCMDGLAVALHCVYHTTSFMAAITRCVNFLGDADSIGAICGQIAGAIYGASALNERLIAAVEMWDGGEISLRAALLFAGAMNLSEEAAAFAEPERSAKESPNSPPAHRSRNLQRSRSPR